MSIKQAMDSVSLAIWYRWRVLGYCAHDRSCHGAKLYPWLARVGSERGYPDHFVTRQAAERFRTEMVSETRRRRCPHCQRPIAAKRIEVGQVRVSDMSEAEYQCYLDREAAFR